MQFRCLTVCDSPVRGGLLLLHLTDIAAGRIIPILSATARKDYLAGSRQNQAYVINELQALTNNDSWYVSVYLADSKTSQMLKHENT
jgi:hypothetical protein